MHAACPAHVILDLITITTGDEYKLKLCFMHFSPFSCYFYVRSKYSPQHFSVNAFSWCSCCRMGDQDLQPYGATGKVVLLYFHKYLVFRKDIGKQNVEMNLICL